jgi:hypothetical protein
LTWRKVDEPSLIDTFDLDVPISAADGEIAFIALMREGWLVQRDGQAKQD